MARFASTSSGVKKTPLRRTTSLQASYAAKMRAKMSAGEHPAPRIGSFKSPKAPKPRKPLPKISEKRKPIQRRYLALRGVFLSDFTGCQFLTCNQKSEDVHHIAGRGGNLCEVSTWMAVCRFHHDYIHQHPGESRSMGYLK